MVYLILRAVIRIYLFRITIVIYLFFLRVLLFIMIFFAKTGRCTMQCLLTLIVLQYEVNYRPRIIEDVLVLL